MYSDDLENLLSFPANRRKNCWAIIHDRPYTFARYNTDLFVMHCNSTSLIARKNPTSASIFPTLKPIYSQHFLIIIRFMRSAHHLPNHSTISCQKLIYLSLSKHFYMFIKSYETLHLSFLIYLNNKHSNIYTATHDHTTQPSLHKDHSVKRSQDLSTR